MSAEPRAGEQWRLPLEAGAEPERSAEESVGGRLLTFRGRAATEGEAAEAAETAETGVASLDAEEAFERAAELEAEDREGAERWYRRCLEARPDHAEALVNLGGILHDRGELAEAERLYRAAYDADRHAVAAFNLGVLMEDRSEPAEAARAYERAIDADPALRDAYLNLARLCEARGDRASAIRYLAKARSLEA